MNQIASNKTLLNKMKVYTDRILIVLISSTLFLTDVMCLKRVPISPTSPEIENHLSMVYVHLKPGTDYGGKHVVAVKEPNVKDDYLVGMHPKEDRKLRIPVSDIDYIEIVRPDLKKFAIYSVAILAIIVYFGLKAAPGLEIK